MNRVKLEKSINGGAKKHLSWLLKIRLVGTEFAHHQFEPKTWRGHIDLQWSGSI